VILIWCDVLCLVTVTDISYQYYGVPYHTRLNESLYLWWIAARSTRTPGDAPPSNIAAVVIHAALLSIVRTRCQMSSSSPATRSSDKDMIWDLRIPVSFAYHYRYRPPFSRRSTRVRTNICFYPGSTLPYEQGCDAVVTDFCDAWLLFATNVRDESMTQVDETKERNNPLLPTPCSPNTL
jgi:hypothetical protein